MEDLELLLHSARERQLSLFTDLDDEQLLGTRQHHVEPPIWEMGHVAWFQELWILRHLDGREPSFPKGDSIYDAFNVSYKLRWSHDFPSREETLRYAEEILRRCGDRLKGSSPTARDAYFYRLATQHEGMHTENLLSVRNTLGYPSPASLASGPPPEIDAGYETHDVEVPAGTYRLGAPRDAPFVFDNEKWVHEVELKPFRIASAPVTNEEFARFVDAGGYTNRGCWGRRGWDWRRRGGFEKPLGWERVQGAWRRRVFDRALPLEPRYPMCHVNLYEADAYCRFAGRRLPTEAEWETAASFDPASGAKRTYPWGEHPPTADLANLDFWHGGTVDVSAFPGGDSPLGCRQMVGNVWEWTSSVFDAYPGFEPDPYAEYSAPYFGQKPVLRGGCYATRADLIRNTWRNFFIRHRRNIFAGVRTCAL